MVVSRGSKTEVLAGEIASQARTADELNDIMRLMMKAALKRMVDTMKSIHILILALCLTNTGFAQPGGSIGFPVSGEML